MTSVQTPPDIFDRDLLGLRRKRAIQRGQLSFLHKRCADDAIERLLDINRQFKNALFIGLPQTRAYFLAQLPAAKRPQTVTERCFAKGTSEFLDEESVSFQAESFDLVVSLLNLQSVNNLPEALRLIRAYLKPDGLFLGALFGGECLQTIRHKLYQLDQNYLGGATARVFPFVDYTQAAGLLHQAGFALPVIDRDRVNVTYSKLNTFLEDLRDMGDTNVLTARNRRYLGKPYYKAFNQSFTDKHPNKISFEIIWMTGWVPHESQQKPLKPGSAQVSLTKVLKDKSDD